ncbi:MAG: ribonuclease P protein component [Patescibacteria group bacterium]
MISNTFRFHGHGSLKYLFRHGKGTRTKYATVKYVQNPKRKNYRLAVIVSKKVAKSAVTRNRIRRRIYELIRKNIDGMPNLDIAIIVHDERVSTVDHTELERSLLPAIEDLKST